jgi:hypothetical protein
LSGRDGEKRWFSHKNEAGDGDSGGVSTLYIPVQNAGSKQQADLFPIDLVRCPRRDFGFVGLVVKFVATVL